MFYFILKDLGTFLAKHSPPLHSILYDRHQDTWKKTRYICRLLCGLLCAWIFWLLIMMNFGFTRRWKNVILWMLILIVGVGFVFFTSVRCGTFLIYIGMIGKSGRSYMRALSFAYIIAGPIGNLATNSGEIVRVFSCTTKLTYNITKARFDLMTKPFTNTLASMKGDIKEVQDSFAEIKDVLEPLRSEVEDEEDTNVEFDEPNNGTNNNSTETRTHARSAHVRSAEEVQQQYAQKFKRRCKLQLERGEQRCRRAFQDARDNCMKKFPRIVRSLLCWPFRVGFICNFKILGNPERICNPKDALPKDFGAGYVELQETERELSEKGNNVSVEYEVYHMETPKELKNSSDTAKEVVREFNEKRRSFDFVMYIMQRILSFLLIKVVYASISYQKRYRTIINHDNMYITDYFKHLDERRRNLGKREVLPLRPLERRKILDLKTPCAHTKDESKAIIFHLLQFALELIISGFFLVLDYLVAYLLAIIREHSKISYCQQGYHTIHFHVNGTGLMAKLMRSTLNNFNMHEHVSTYLTNEHCLPRPSFLPTSFYVKLILLYLAIVLLIYKSSVFLRLGRLVCGYFFRKREKQRILYLYNNIRRQRRTLFESMLKKAKDNVSKQKVRQKVNCILRLRLCCPKWFDWLKYFKIARRKCLICEFFEDKHFGVCSNSECGVVYCHDCTEDIQTKCLVCQQQIKTLKKMHIWELFKVLSSNELETVTETV